MNLNETAIQSKNQSKSKINSMIAVISFSLSAFLFVVFAFPFIKLTTAGSASNGTIYELVKGEDMFKALLIVSIVVCAADAVVFTLWHIGNVNNAFYKYISKKILQVSLFVTASMLLITTVITAIYTFATGGYNSGNLAYLKTITPHIGFYFLVLCVAAIAALTIIFALRLNKK